VNYVKSKLQECFQHGGLDTDCDGMISKDEFAKILDNPLAARSLTEVGVDVFGLVDLQDFIFEAEDENGESKEKQLSFCDFMEVVLQLRGSNNATVKDIVDLRKFVQKKQQDAGGESDIQASQSKPQHNLGIRGWVSCFPKVSKQTLCLSWVAENKFRHTSPG